MNSLERRIENFGAEKIFIALFVLFGVTTLLMRPPYQLMDEINHLPRAWQISEGIFLSPTMTIGDFVNGADVRSKKIFSLSQASADAWGDKVYFAEMPVSFLPDDFIVDANYKHYIHAFSVEGIEKFLATPLNAKECEPVLIPNTGAYPPPTYLPQVIAAFIGQSLNLSAGAIYYLMGLSGLIFVAICVFWAMKFLPEAKTLIFLLAMMPMFLVEAASTSADAVTFGVCFLGTAWLLSLRNSTEKFSRAEIFGLIILAIMLACSKAVYGTILLLYFLIPRERVGGLKKFLSLGAGLLILNLLTSLGWTELATNTTNVEPATSRIYLGLESVDIAAQKNFVAEHPAEFFNAIINSFGIGAIYYWISFIGLWGANGHFHLPYVFYLVYGITLIFFALTNGLRLTLAERAMLLFAAGISTTAFFLFDYLIWTSVGAEWIARVQVRYFIPIAPMILVASSILPPMRHKNLIALVVGVSGGVVMLAANFLAFY